MSPPDNSIHSHRFQRVMKLVMRGPGVPFRYRKHKLKSEIVGGLNEKFIFATRRTTQESEPAHGHQDRRIRLPFGLERCIHSITSSHGATRHTAFHSAWADPGRRGDDRIERSIVLLLAQRRSSPIHSVRLEPE